MANTSSVVTLEFLQELVQEDEPGVVLHDFQSAAGSVRGDNYTAMLLRVSLRGSLDGKPWARSVICKVLPTSATTYKSDALFRNEVAFYTRALPALRQFQEPKGAPCAQSAQAQKAFLPIPKCYRALDDVLVLEDLRDRGFVMTDRKKGWGHQHLRAVLSQMARFHALSLAMKAQEPELFAREVAGAVSESLFRAENEDWYRDYYRAANRSAIRMVRDGLPEGEDQDRCLAAAESFLLEGNFFSRMCELMAPHEPLAVLCHGDCWTNNFLFRYGGHADAADNDQGADIEEVMLVDFQLCRYGSPVLDLVVLLYCCTDRALREENLHDLLRHYHGELVSSLGQLGCSPDQPHAPPYACPDQLWDMLQEDMRRLARLGFGLAVDYLPLSTCEPDEAPDYCDDQVEQTPGAAELDGAPPMLLPVSDLCVRRMADLVRELVHNGLL